MPGSSRPPVDALLGQTPGKRGFVGRRLTVLGRALRLRCPRCGRGALFEGWFSMRPKCSVCELDLTREPGFYLGSIYVNYGLTALFVTFVYPACMLFTNLPDKAVLGGLLAFCVVFPVWFFRYARSIWLGFDQVVDPDPLDPHLAERSADPWAIRSSEADAVGKGSGPL